VAGGSSGQPPVSPPGLASDDVPETVVARAKEAFRRRSGALSAAVVHDSAWGAADGSDRAIRFAHARGDIEVSVSLEAGRCTVAARPAPAATAVRLEFAADEAVSLVESGREGTFEFCSVPRGLVRLWVDFGPGLPAVASDWFRI